MEKDVRNRIQRATQAARQLLEGEYREQLEGVFDILLDGSIAEGPGSHLTAEHRVVRDKLVAVVAHKRASGLGPGEAVAAYLREAAFTMLNRLVALKMLEARGLVQECVSKAEESSGFREFLALASGLGALPDKGYQLYVESLFDEIGREVGILFDRRDVASLLWPRRQALHGLLAILNDTELRIVWAEDETIGWVYQYFNSEDERTRMRAESQSPRDSRELAIRNQFFTPRYVVKFLTENTLGQSWLEMRQGSSKLRDLQYLVRRPAEASLVDGEDSPATDIDGPATSQSPPLEGTGHIRVRSKTDPRDIGVLDPACGSGHFLLYAFDLLIVMYEEAWADEQSPPSQCSKRTLREDYPTLEALRTALPSLILEHNLHGIDIDPRCCQIASFALWMRAQKAHADIGTPPVRRRPILKTNIVAAEPMPGSEELRRGFLSQLKPELRQLVECVFERMDLAGEAGALLRIEEDIREAVREIHGEHGALFRELDEDLWETAEKQVLSALRDYAEQATSAENFKRRLFAHDASLGFAFIDLCRKRYHVTLMNPPFGLPVDRTQSLLDTAYAGAHNDIYAAFVRRGRELAPEGRTGAITSRSFLVARRLEKFRRNDVIPAIETLLDLGLGVMDSASVEAAAYVLSTSVTGLFAADARSQLRALENAEAIQTWSPIDRAVFPSLPRAKILYRIPPEMARLLRHAERFEPAVGTAREGMKTFNNERFVRVWWEVPSDQIGWDRKWRWFAKGGRNARFWGPLPLVLNWDKDGAELEATNIRVNGSTAQVRQASSYWGRLGLTYSRRAPEFCPRLLPQKYVFSDKGPAIIVDSDQIDVWFALGWLSSRLVRSLLVFQVNKQDYLTGIIKALPWKPPPSNTAQCLKTVVKEAVSSRMAADRFDDTSPLFDPRIIMKEEGDHLGDLVHEHDATASQAEQAALALADSTIDLIYGVESSDWLAIAEPDSEEESHPDPEDEIDETTTNQGSRLSSAELRHLKVSAALFTAFGRGRLNAEPACNDLLRLAVAEPRVPTQRGDQVVFCDDPGHGSDVVAALGACGITEHSLRDYLAGSATTGFFREHAARHSTRSRKAPIYWQLATPSASFSVWLHYHCMTRDTFFKVLNDLVAPKVQHEERKLTARIQEAGLNPSAAQRRGVDDQENFVEELRAFRAEVARIAPLWNPDLNDGVIINFAPLWRLVPQHRQWQNECKKCWDKLVAGDYDWAYLAMHLWPERVVPKCAEDRSLAIAHDLEQVFWAEDEDGTWQPRSVQPSAVEALIRERTSPAVKATLSDLLSAPPPVGAKKATRRRATARTGRSARKPPARTQSPKSTVPAETPRARSPQPVDDVTLTAVCEAIASVAEGASKSDVLAATGLSDGEWNRAIQALLERGDVTRTGAKRGTRYHAGPGERS